MQLGHDVETLWHHPHASPALKKRIVRTIIEEVVVSQTDGDAPQLIVIVHWKGGVHTRLQIPKNTTGKHSRTTDREVIDVIRQLAMHYPDHRIAWVLNRLGYQTATSLRWNERRVRSVRSQHNIPACDAANASSLTLEQAAKSLGVSNTFVRALLRRNILPGQQVVPNAPWTILAADLHLPQVVRAVRALHTGARGQRFSPGQEELF
jgi:hypothetical protein